MLRAKWIIFEISVLPELQRAAKQNLMVLWRAVEQRGVLMTRRHLQRLTEGVYHFSRRTQSTVELWYPWVSSRPLTLPVFLSINFIARGLLAWHLLLFIRFFNFIRTAYITVDLCTPHHHQHRYEKLKQEYRAKL